MITRADRTRIIWTICATVLFSALAVTAQETAEAGTSKALADGRTLTDRFYRGELNQVHDQFSADFKASMSIEDLIGLRRQVSSQLGSEAAVIDESVKVDGEYTIYRRLAKFADHDGQIEVMWAFRSDATVAGFVIRDPRGASGD